jgi:hypothetical protein
MTMGNIQELEKQLAEAKAEEKRKELQTLTENLISKYQGTCRSHSFEKNRSAYASAVFYEKFWVTGNTITVLKWNISFAEQEEITNSQVISCL